MPAIDIKTLFYLFGAGNVFFILFFAAYFLLNRKTIPIINIFIVAKQLAVFVWILFSMRQQIAPIYSVLLANCLLIFATAYEIYSIAFAHKKFKWNLFLRVNIIPLILCIVFFIVLNKPENTRVIVASFIMASLYLSAGIYLNIGKTRTKLQQLAGFISSAVGIMFVLRAIYAWIISKDTLLFTNNIQVITYLFLFLVSISWPIVILLILKEKDQVIIKRDNIELTKLNHNKDKFFSIIAHDLKGPIGALLNLGQVLLDEHKEIDNEHREKLIDSINQSSKKTYNLLENLLQWARSESGRLEMSPQLINLNDIIDNNLALYSEKIELKKIKAIKDTNDELIAFADYNMLDTVIRNLISNAVKFTHPEGEIKITAKKIEGDLIRICISDTGVGIPAEIVRTLFDIDSNYKQKGTQNEGGTGLGLKLCKEFINKNDGGISVRSELGKGSAFCITLPSDNRKEGFNQNK